MKNRHIRVLHNFSPLASGQIGSGHPVQAFSVQSPWDDLLGFDWVLASGSTLAASAVLGIPQSTLSRRFRSFCSAHRLRVGRQSGGLNLLSDETYVADLRALAQSFRCRHGLCCYALSAEDLLSAEHPLHLPGRPLVLSQALFGRIDQFFEQGILDIACITRMTTGRRSEAVRFVSVEDRLTGFERDGLLSFCRRLELELQPASLSSAG